MKATALCLGVFFLLGLSVLPAKAQVIGCSPVYRRPLGQAPDTCRGCGFYVQNHLGMVYGPNYYLRPPFPPVQGTPPLYPHGHGGPFGGMVSFPYHVYARSPRDFFMWGEANEDELSRLRHRVYFP